MILFFVTEKINLRYYYDVVSHTYAHKIHIDAGPTELRNSAHPDALHWDFCLEPPGSRIATENVYFSTDREFQRLTEALRELNQLAALRVVGPTMVDSLLARMNVPPRLGTSKETMLSSPELMSQIRVLGKGRVLKLAMITPFGMRLGDNLLFCALVRCLRHKLATESYGVTIHLYQRFFEDETAQLYREQGLFDAIYDLPARLSLLCDYDGYFDLSIAYAPDHLAWIDGLLHLCGIRWQEIPGDLKRPKLKASPPVETVFQSIIEEIRKPNIPVVLFHPTASTPVRSIPQHKIASFLSKILSALNVTIITVVPVPFCHDHLKDLSEACKSLQHLAYLISIADAFLSVDTSIYHLADALSTPGVVLFTTVPSHLRVKYYPHTVGIDLARADDDLELRNLHFSDRPQILEKVESWWDDSAIDSVVASFATYAERWFGLIAKREQL